MGGGGGGGGGLERAVGGGGEEEGTGRWSLKVPLFTYTTADLTSPAPREGRHNVIAL